MIESEAGAEETVEGEVKEAKGEGRWTEEEHEKFLEAYKLYGKNWKLIQKHIGTRSAAQSRSHAQKYFRRINRAKNAENTKEATPLNSPTCNPMSESPVKENTSSVKSKRSAKRVLRFDEEVNKKQTTELITEEIRVAEEEAKLIKEQEAFLDTELVFVPQMPLLMNLQYESYVYSPWEKELDIDNFKKRIASYGTTEQSNENYYVGEEERVGEDYTELQSFSRSRTLSSMFE